MASNTISKPLWQRVLSETISWMVTIALVSIPTAGGFLIATDLAQNTYQKGLTECAKENNVYQCEWVAVPKKVN